MCLYNQIILTFYFEGKINNLRWQSSLSRCELDAAKPPCLHQVHNMWGRVFPGTRKAVAHSRSNPARPTPRPKFWSALYWLVALIKNSSSFTNQAGVLHLALGSRWWKGGCNCKSGNSPSPDTSKLCRSGGRIVQIFYYTSNAIWK